MDIHVKLHNTEVFKKSVTNMGTKVYNNLPRSIKETDDYKAFKKRVKTIPSLSLFLLIRRICIFLVINLGYLSDFKYTKI